MLIKIRKLTTLVWLAVTTFAIGVALTTLCVIPRFGTEKIPAELALSNLPQPQQRALPDGWRQLLFNNKVLILLPHDMRSEELFGDSLRYREAYSNGQVHLTIIGDVMLPEAEARLREARAFTCDPPEILKKTPTYHESLLEIDGRSAKLGIARRGEHEIVASVCFPNADDSAYELLMAANCKDDQALVTIQQIFRSVKFKTN